MDTDPILEGYIPPAPDSGAGQQAFGAGSEGSVPGAECLACAIGSADAPCVDKWEACKAIGKCEPFYKCGARRFCYDENTNPVSCLTNCGVESGLTVASDPALGPFIAMRQCTIDNCAEACRAK